MYHVFPMLALIYVVVEGWSTSGLFLCNQRLISKTNSVRIFLSSETGEKDSEEIRRTSFDDAGRSLVEEEDRKRLEQMGDFDSTGDQNNNAARMRAAIRQRTASMGIEKSQASALYIAEKEAAARLAGPPGAQKDPDSFGGLDLSQISDTKMKNSASDWNEDMPTMLYDPEDEMTKEEKEEADPLMLKNPLEQALYEISQTTWPAPGSALREVVVVLIVIAFTTAIIVSWDRFLKDFYTNIGFIPSKEDLASYAQRFDGLDLPEGWMENMNEEDIQQFSDKVNSGTLGATVVPEATGSLPEF